MNAKFLRNGIVMLVLVVGTVALLAAVLISPNGTNNAKPYSAFLQDVSAGSVTSVTQQDQVLTVNKSSPGAYTVIVPTVLTQVWTDVATAAASRQQDAAVLRSRQGPRQLVARPRPHRGPADRRDRRLHHLHDAPGPGHQ